MPSIIAKLGTMRKEVEWTIYPPHKDGRIILQSEHYIAVFDTSGRGLLSKRQGGGAYFLHLSPACGAGPVMVPQDVILAALAAQPQPGQEIGPGVRVM